jgi:negative regulator of sigma E activity
MNRDFELKLQAWVDGELPDEEAREVASLAQADHVAQGLVTELRLTKGFLTGNEPETALPESHDFHWSKIRREIERLDREEAPAPSLPWATAWRRMLAPLSGVALVALVTVVSLNLFRHPQTDDALANLVEVENPSEHIGSISYKSQAENMFVVWLYDKENDAETKSDMPDPLDDMILQ